MGNIILGNISGSGSTGPGSTGNYVFNGTNNNFYGNIFLNGGTLTLTTPTAFQYGILTYNTGNGTLATPGLSTLVLGGLNGNHTLDISGMTFNVGGSPATNGGSQVNAATSTYSGILTSTASAGNLVKSGSGTFTLLGQNTYNAVSYTHLCWVPSTPWKGPRSSCRPPRVWAPFCLRLRR